MKDMRNLFLFAAILLWATTVRSQVLLKEVTEVSGNQELKVRILEQVHAPGYTIEVANGANTKSFALSKLDGGEFAQKLRLAVDSLQKPDEGLANAEADPKSGSEVKKPEDNKGQEFLATKLYETMLKAVEEQKDLPDAGWISLRPEVMAVRFTKRKVLHGSDCACSICQPNPEIATMRLPRRKRYSISLKKYGQYDAIQASNRSGIAAARIEIDGLERSESLIEQNISNCKAEIAKLGVELKGYTSQRDSFVKAENALRKGYFDKILEQSSQLIKLEINLDSLEQISPSTDEVKKQIEGVKKQMDEVGKKEFDQWSQTSTLIGKSLNELDAKIQTAKTKQDHLSNKTLPELHESYTVAKTAHATKVNEGNKQFQVLHLEDLQIEFNQGMIERIVASMSFEQAFEGEEDGEQLIFTNGYPIGFSVMRNFNQGIRKQLLYNPDNNLVVPLAALLRYQPNLRLNTRDFSPADTIFSMDDGEFSYAMKKEPTSEILKGGVFTDIVGIQSDAPNGLVQFEVDKRINLYTTRVGLWRSGWANVAAVQFIRPSATFSKVDGKLREMPSSYAAKFVNGVPQTELLALNTDLLQYENFSAGLDLNLGILDLQPMKSTIFLNAGARFGHVVVGDTVRRFSNDTIINTGVLKPFGMNTFRAYPEMALEIYPDERIRIQASYRVQGLLAMNEVVHVIPRLGGSAKQTGLPNRLVHSIQLGATLKVNPKLEFYVRYRMHIQNLYWKTNFEQVQFGTSFSVMKKLEVK